MRWFVKEKKAFNCFLCIVLLLAVTISLSPCAFAENEKSSLEVHFLDVGQGDASLIVCDGKAMLIDGGKSDKSSLIYSYLHNKGINKLEYIVCTHPDEDHNGGLAGALNAVQVNNALSSVNYDDSDSFRAFLKYLENQKVRLTIPEAGAEYKLGSAEFQILGPTVMSEEPNNISLVLKLVYGNVCFLFTGDAEKTEEKSIMQFCEYKKIDLTSTVIKIGHHGSSNSTSDEFLQAVNPEYAIISVGADNPYSHPSKDVIDKLSKNNIVIMRTDINGTIVCRSDGDSVNFETEKDETDTTSNEIILGTAASSEEQDAEVSRATLQEEQKTVTYILNTNSKKFHRPNCPSVGKMKNSNKREFTGTREEAIASGYEPCHNCNP